MDYNIVGVDASIMAVDASGVRVTVNVCCSFDNVVDDVVDDVVVALVTDVAAVAAVVVPSTILSDARFRRRRSLWFLPDISPRRILPSLQSIISTP